MPYVCRSLAIALSLAALPAWAARDRPFFQASRALAMGDAYTAHDVGFEAVYYNPAGVARPAAAQAKILDLEFVLSQGALSLFSQAFSGLAGMSQLAQNVTNNPGVNQALGFSLTPQFLIKNFSIGAVARTYADAYLASVGGDLNFYATTDLALYTNAGVSLFGGVLKLGVGGKALNRAEVNRAYTPAEYSSGLSFGGQFQEGIGYGVDVGALLTYPSALMPALGVAVLDVGNTKLLDRRVLFTGSGGAPGAPNPLQQKINVGLSLNPKHGRGLKSSLAFEMKDVANTGGKEALDRFHLGYELNLRSAFYLRAGLNQGRYWTAGLGIQGQFAALEFASYGENISFDSATRVDDRKYVVRYVFGF
jgi:hypothetical protein